MSKPLKVLRPTNLNGLAMDSGIAAGVHEQFNIDDRIGFEIRDLRKARSITLSALAEATGLSQGYLSQIERGISSPSIKALHSISRALGVTISWFFMTTSESDTDLREYVVRASRRRKLTFVSGITDELLSPNLSRQLELLRCTFEPGAESGSEPYTHHGEEAGIVLSGELNLWIGDKHVVLHEGDSFAFSSDTPHRYVNKSKEKCVVVWAMTPPTY